MLSNLCLLFCSSGPELSIETVGKLTPIAKILNVRGIGEMCNYIIIWKTFCRECVSAGVSIPPLLIALRWWFLLYCHWEYHQASGMLWKCGP